MGRIPWPLSNDDDVRHFVISLSFLFFIPLNLTQMMQRKIPDPVSHSHASTPRLSKNYSVSAGTKILSFDRPSQKLSRTLNI